MKIPEAIAFWVILALMLVAWVPFIALTIWIFRIAHP